MQKAKILIVDDYPAQLWLFDSYLTESFNCRIYKAENGEDAVAKIKGNNFDLVLLDIKMPGISGFDVMREIKRKEQAPDILVITAWDSIQIAEEAIRQGASDYLPKPVELKNLKSRVKSILARRGKHIGQ